MISVYRIQPVETSCISCILILLNFQQSGFNDLHPNDAFDSTKLQEFAGKVNSMSVREWCLRDEYEVFSA